MQIKWIRETVEVTRGLGGNSLSQDICNLTDSESLPAGSLLRGAWEAIAMVGEGFERRQKGSCDVI